MIDMRQGRCPLCHHHEIIASWPLDFGHGDQGWPEAVTYAQFPPRPNDPRGLIERYSCRRCGFSQTFARDPLTIPIGDAFRTRLIVGPPVESPYR